MQYLNTIIILAIVSSSSSKLLCQKLNISIQSNALVSSHDNLQPHYQYANHWGIVTALDQSNIFLVGGVKTQILNKQQIQLKSGISGVIKTEFDESFLHEIYLSGKAFNFIDFNIGKEAYTPLSYNDELTVGGFFMNSNVRPLPRVTLGIYEYLPLGFTNNWIEIKGGISQGFLNDEREVENKNYASNPLLHEKWAYVRVGKSKIKPYVGLAHSSIFGGTRSNGYKIPIDFWATFKGSASKELGETNATGAHEGFWDFGFYITNELGKFHVYYQKPFADASGLKLWQLRNKDYKLGILSEIENFKWIKKVSLEFIRTEYQSGAGIPDPIYPEGHSKEGQIIWVGDIEDYDSFMWETFGVETEDWDRDDVWNYLEQEENYGHKYGGRDDYNNNGEYYNGWTYHGQNIGLPLYHTYSQANAYVTELGTNNRVVFMNNRVRAIHIGLEGQLLQGLNYRIKSSFTKNYGSYREEYTNRYSWEEVDNYFYKGGKNQIYSQLKFAYSNNKWKNLQVQTSFSYDAGQLYHAFGWMIGINYTPSL